MNVDCQGNAAYSPDNIHPQTDVCKFNIHLKEIMYETVYLTLDNSRCQYCCNEIANIIGLLLSRWLDKINAITTKLHLNDNNK